MRGSGASMVLREADAPAPGVERPSRRSRPSRSGGSSAPSTVCGFTMSASLRGTQSRACSPALESGQIGDPELVRDIVLKLSGAFQEDGFVVVAVSGGEKAALAREMHGLVAHQAVDLHVLHDPAAIPQLRVHGAPAIGGGIASITCWVLAMGIVQVPSETHRASPLTPESASRYRPTPCAWPTDRSPPPASPC